MSLSQGGFFVIQFGGSVILARLLTPYELGVYAVAAAVIGVIGAVQAFGLAGFVVREHELSPDLLASTFTINACLAAMLAAAIVGLSSVSSSFLRETGVRNVMMVLATLPLLGAFEFLPSTNLERRGRFELISLVSLMRALSATAVTVGLAFCGFSFMSIAYGNVAGAVVSIVLFNTLGRQHVSFRLSLSEWRRVTKFGLQMVAISGVNALGGRAAELVMGRLLGLSALGLYARASSLNSLLWDNIHLVIGRVVFVDFADLRRKGVSLHDSYLRTVDVVTAVLWPAFAGFAILSGPLIETVYGDKWVGAAQPLSLLSVAAIVLVSITMTWEVFVVCGETGRQARFEVFRAGAGLALFSIGCTVGLVGAATARIGEAILSLFLYRPHLERLTETRLREFLPIYARSAALTLIAVAPATALMVLRGWSEHTPLLSVLTAIGAGIAGWLLALRWLRHPLQSELTRLAGSFRTLRQAS